MYHATDYKNLNSIMQKGILTGVDGVVYLTENPLDALKFVAVRGLRQIIVIKIKILKRDEKNIVEMFDHNPVIFKCRCYGYVKAIKGNMFRLMDIRKYENPL